MRLTTKQIKQLADKYHVDLDVISIRILRRGIETELEHKALIEHDPEKTLIIALAHLPEYPDYYKDLHEWRRLLRSTGHQEICQIFSNTEYRADSDELHSNSRHAN